MRQRRRKFKIIEDFNNQRQRLPCQLVGRITIFKCTFEI